MEKYQYILIESHISYCILTLNRPEKRNAISRIMRKELEHFFQHTAYMYPVVILTGAGVAFCAGLDLKENPTVQDANDYMKLLKNIYDHNSVCIAAVNGAARGGGFMLANVCDVVLASNQATFGMPKTVPVSGSPDKQDDIQQKTSKWMRFAGKKLSAIELLGMEILDEVIEHEDLLNKVKARAECLSTLAIKDLVDKKKSLNSQPFNNDIKKRTKGQAWEMPN